MTNAFPPGNPRSALTYFLRHLGNAISAGWKDGHRRLGETLGDRLDGILKVGRVGEVHHLSLFGRKTFRHVDNLKFLNQFLEVDKARYL